MMTLHRSLLCAVVALAVFASESVAQNVPGWRTKQVTLEQIDADRIRLMREVEIIGEGPNAGQQMFADELLWNTRTGDFSAEGNVLIVSPTGRIAAERVTFNTKTGLGTFHTASGIASLGDRGVKDKSMFGTLEPDVYFYGERIDKIGEDKYRITKGGFTTCVQPTPRWEIVSGSMTINLEDYAVLRNAVIRVKDVPVFYLPVMYYPIQSDDRATGFLLPTYGNSTYRGQSISNAFFWAINRSQDATFFHDWMFSRGQGMGAEYRYRIAAGSGGQVRIYRLNEQETQFAVGSGDVTRPARQSYDIRGDLTHALPLGLTARGRVDYFTDVTARQLYQNDYFYAVSSRHWTGTVTGARSGVTLNGTVSKSEYFPHPSYSLKGSALPLVTAALSSRQLGRLPLFFSAQSEFSRTEAESQTRVGLVINRLTRADVFPLMRVSLSTIPFLQLNGSVGWRYTYASEHLDEITQLQVPGSIDRKYFDLRADVTGPVFSRVYSPRNRLAERLKHVIEPRVSFQRITDIPNWRQVPAGQTGYDYVVGGAGSVTYGLTNRVIVRPQTSNDGVNAGPTTPREVLSVGIQQSYYTVPAASQYDQSYRLSFLYRDPRKYSPILLNARSQLTKTASIDFRMEYDTTTSVAKLQGLGLSGSINSANVQASGGWSKRLYAVGDVISPDSYIQSSTTIKSKTGTVGGSYSFNFDLHRSNLLQQRWIGFYNAQCCGISVEYQEHNFPTGDSRFLIPKDRRFNLSFSLAGIGTFSNFFGAFGGTTTGGSRY